MLDLSLQGQEMDIFPRMLCIDFRCYLSVSSLGLARNPKKDRKGQFYKTFWQIKPFLWCWRLPYQGIGLKKDPHLRHLCRVFLRPAKDPCSCTQSLPNMRILWDLVTIPLGIFDLPDFIHFLSIIARIVLGPETPTPRKPWYLYKRPGKMRKMRVITPNFWGSHHLWGVSWLWFVSPFPSQSRRSLIWLSCTQ